MPRTTLNIDAPILKDLKRLQKERRETLGRLVSDLLAWALRNRQRTARDDRPPFTWRSRPMHCRINLGDKEALWSALDQDLRKEGRH